MDLTQRSSLRILVVDDVLKNIQVIGTMLREQGYMVSIAQNGEEALRLCEKDSPDLILLDIMMPGMDGFEVCRKLKADKATKNIPVIFLTGLTGMENKIHGFNIGVVDYVTKPVESKELLARIKTHLTISCLQRELTESNEKLEEKVQLRTQELAKMNEALRHAQKMEAIGTLAGGIAHDFNNVLNVILGYSELLEHDLPQGSNNKNFAEAIRSAALRAADLIRQILAFSKQKDDEHLPTKLHNTLKEVITFLRGSLPATIELKQKIKADGTYVLADPTQIHQITMNLCANAYHAMRETGGTLEIELNEVEVDAETAQCHPDLSEGQYIQLAVRDSGHGMDEKTMQRIFEPYYTTKTINEGTGLGLATVHGIVKSHKGAITVESEVSKGSTFTVYLPALEVEDTSEIAQLETEDYPKLKGRVLFVDNAQTNVVLGKILLDKLGCEVVGLRSSQKALDIFRKDPDSFDLVIADQTMPHLTGYELSKLLLDVRPDLPIIMITGHSDIVDEQKAKAIGIREFLMKPLNLATLAKALCASLEK